MLLLYFRGGLIARSKGQRADCGKTLYRGLTVPNYAPEKGKGHPPVMEAEAAAAMTCPGVPTHRKRLRPAERVETESATYAECLSRSGSGGHGQRRGRVAAQCRLSAPQLKRW